MIEDHEPGAPERHMEWTTRLSALVSLFVDMGPKERRAAINYLKSLYSTEWPQDY